MHILEVCRGSVSSLQPRSSQALTSIECILFLGARMIGYLEPACLSFLIVVDVEVRALVEAVVQRLWRGR